MTQSQLLALPFTDRFALVIFLGFSSSGSRLFRVSEKIKYYESLFGTGEVCIAFDHAGLIKSARQIRVISDRIKLLTDICCLGSLRFAHSLAERISVSMTHNHAPKADRVIRKGRDQMVGRRWVDRVWCVR